jgi:molybdopterin synthase catalytic subunit
MTTSILVSDEPLDIAGLHDAVADHQAGAIVVFTGHVRNHSPGKVGVTHLDYEVFEERVEVSINEIAEEAAARWPVLQARVLHRTGICDVGEPTVAVAVSAAHRADAFDAARYLIDELKARAPIWKKEHWPGGAEWSPGS